MKPYFELETDNVKLLKQVFHISILLNFFKNNNE